MAEICQTYEEITPGSEVWIRGIEFVCKVTDKSEGFLYVSYWWWYDHEFDSCECCECVDFSRYSHTFK